MAARRCQSRNKRRRKGRAAVAIFALGLFAAQDKPDLDMMNRIRYEGLQHSQVGKPAAFFSDVIGPRPTGSPEIDRANKWAAAKMKEWGLANVALEPYDDFGVGWALRYVSAHLIEPHCAPLIAISVEWGSSTRGKISGQLLYVDIRSKDDFRLRDARPPHEHGRLRPPGRRGSDALPGPPVAKEGGVHAAAPGDQNAGESRALGAMTGGRRLRA